MLRQILTSALVCTMTVGINSAYGNDKTTKDIVTTAVEAGSFKTLAAALEAAGLVETLQGKGPFTVLAPTDAAFAKLPQGTVENLLKPENKQQLISVLTYHVLAGTVGSAEVVKLQAAETLNGQRIDIKVADGQVQVDQAHVVQTDIACSNGVIHVIDQVILPASDSIVTVASNAGTFSTLLAAAKAAGLVDALNGAGPLTVFAPTDAAFAALPKGTVEKLLKPENKAQLASILSYHVLPGRLYSTELLKGHAAETLQGASLQVQLVNGKPQVMGAGIVAADLDAANGVIHVIDKVLMPPVEKKKAAALSVPQTREVQLCPVTGRVVRRTTSARH
jgi:uncharacterized surface protein with fasciclin (FAS1) repeats